MKKKWYDIIMVTKCVHVTFSFLRTNLLEVYYNLEKKY